MNIALILAGGTGRRLGGDIPKQYIEVEGKPILFYCLETFATHEEIHGIWIVAEKEWHSTVSQWIKEWDISGFQGFSKPGKTRQLSIWNGLQDIMGKAGKEDAVIIHDAARPLVSKRLISDCLKACKEHDGALATLPMKDTVYYGADGRIESLLDRSKVMAGQAPEAFRLEKYYRANEALFPEKILSINGSTEPAVMAGMDICCVPGEEENFKVTTGEDLKRLQQILSAKNGR